MFISQPALDRYKTLINKTDKTRLEFVVSQALTEFEANKRPLVCSGKRPFTYGYNTDKYLKNASAIMHEICRIEEAVLDGNLDYSELDTVSRVMLNNEMGLDFDCDLTYQKFMDEVKDLSDLTHIKSPTKGYPHLHFLVEGNPTVEEVNALCVNNKRVVAYKKTDKIINGKPIYNCTIELKAFYQYMTMAKYNKDSKSNQMQVVNGDRFKLNTISKDRFLYLMSVAKKQNEAPQVKSRLSNGFDIDAIDEGQELSSEDSWIRLIAAKANEMALNLDLLVPLLESAGYTFRRTMFSRPGKSISKGFSGSISDNNTAIFFSNNDLLNDSDEDTYTIKTFFGIYTKLVHDGNEFESAEDLAYRYNFPTYFDYLDKLTDQEIQQDELNKYFNQPQPTTTNLS